MIWFLCPNCGQKLFLMRPDAVIRGIQIKCKKCKELIDIEV